jgi:hypothetical protein
MSVVADTEPVALILAITFCTYPQVTPSSAHRSPPSSRPRTLSAGKLRPLCSTAALGPVMMAESEFLFRCYSDPALHPLESAAFARRTPEPALNTLNLDPQTVAAA